jgi:hypothetical protein
MNFCALAARSHRFELFEDIRLVFALGWIFQIAFFRQQKDHSQRPDTADRASNGPEFFASAAIFGDYAAENRIEKMHERSGAPERGWVHFGFDEKKPGEITKQSIEIHGTP